MDGTALVLWIVTIAGGASLAVMWLIHGGWERPADAETPASRGGRPTTTLERDRSKIGVSSILAHATLGILGAIFWQLYRLNEGDPGYDPAKWLALAFLLSTIAVGMGMFVRWVGVRRQAATDPEAMPPERRLPSLVVIAHGLAAIATLVLVVLALIE